MTKTTQKITTAKLNTLINEHMNNLPKNGDIVKGIVLSVKKSILVVDIDGFTTGVIRGNEIKHLPLEYEELEPGDPIEAMVVDIENENGQMELSLKAAAVESAWNFIREKEQSQEVIEVTIVNANKGGLLATIRTIPAFLPVSQLTPEHYPRVEGGDKKKILKKLRLFIRKTLPVKIISFNPEEEKIIISEKKAWEETQKQKLATFKIGDTVKATIKTITNFGAFVTFADNLEGLIHISEIPTPEDTSATLNDILSIDSEVDARIINIKGTKVFLSLKPS